MNSLLRSVVLFVLKGSFLSGKLSTTWASVRSQIMTFFPCFCIQRYICAITRVFSFSWKNCFTFFRFNLSAQSHFPAFSLPLFSVKHARQRTKLRASEHTKNIFQWGWVTSGDRQERYSTDLRKLQSICFWKFLSFRARSGRLVVISAVAEKLLLIMLSLSFREIL